MHYLVSFSELPDHELLRWHAEQTGTPGGVYEVLALSPGTTTDTPKFRSINRVLGRDPRGVLYLGWTWDFARAALALGGVQRADRDSHEAGFRSVYGTHEGLRAAFPEEVLAVAFTFRENPVDAGAKALAEYMVRLGELPPMNETLG